MTQASRPRVAVVVLGDIGRSPRMQYQALATADAGAAVDLVGFADHPPGSALREHPRIATVALADTGTPRSGFGLLARGLWRALRQAAVLFAALCVRVRPPDVILVQSPPAFPTLPIAWAAARLRGARLIVDWHNLGFSRLALRLGDGWTAQLAARGEGWWGRRADAHLCVSRALRHALADRWGIAATVLYDRPARQFAPLPEAERRRVAAQLWQRVGGRADVVPALAVSPTSWTADEDFGLLLDALADCAARLDGAAQSGPALLMLLTGTGPLRGDFEARLARLPRTRVLAATAWLPADEYPMALAAADLGVSLHRSASGLDLPMKIADMFGAGLPVCAFDYGPCLREMVRPGEDAVLFTSASELAGYLCRLVRGAAEDAALWARLRAGASAAAIERWDDAWAAHARAIVLDTRAAPAADPR